MKINVFAMPEKNLKKKKYYLVFYREDKRGFGKMYASIYCKDEKEATELSNRINFGKYKEE